MSILHYLKTPFYSPKMCVLGHKDKKISLKIVHIYSLGEIHNGLIIVKLHLSIPTCCIGSLYIISIIKYFIQLKWLLAELCISFYNRFCVNTWQFCTRCLSNEVTNPWFDKWEELAEKKLESHGTRLKFILCLSLCWFTVSPPPLLTNVLFLLPSLYLCGVFVPH